MQAQCIEVGTGLLRGNSLGDERHHCPAAQIVETEIHWECTSMIHAASVPRQKIH